MSPRIPKGANAPRRLPHGASARNRIEHLRDLVDRVAPDREDECCQFRCIERPDGSLMFIGYRVARGEAAAVEEWIDLGQEPPEDLMCSLCWKGRGPNANATMEPCGWRGTPRPQGEEARRQKARLVRLSLRDLNGFDPDDPDLQPMTLEEHRAQRYEMEDELDRLWYDPRLKF